MKTNDTVKVELGPMLDVMTEVKKHPPSTYEVNGEYYFDYYTDIAGEMFVSQQKSLMKDGHFFTLNSEEPKDEDDKIIRLAFGNMRIWKLK